MDVEAAFKKVFAKLDELNKRVNKADPNGKLDDIKREMKTVAANSQVVVSTMHAHGDSIRRLEQAVESLTLRCPACPVTQEQGDVVGNGADRNRPSSSEYEALAAVSGDVEGD